jgi:secondary thiamine-phosphate synthase enzyme
MESRSRRLQGVKVKRLHIDTGSEPCVVDLTDEVMAFVRGDGDGLVSVSLPHATAGLALMELGSGSEADLFHRLGALLPRDHRYRHAHGSPGHGADHLLPAFVSPTLTLPVIDGRVVLGTWQRIALVDTNADNPRRQVVLAFLSG